MIAIGKLKEPGDSVTVRVKGYYDLSLFGEFTGAEVVLERSFDYSKKEPDKAYWGQVAPPYHGATEVQCAQLAHKAWVRARLVRINDGEVNVRIGK